MSNVPLSQISWESMRKRQWIERQERTEAPNPSKFADADPVFTSKRRNAEDLQEAKRINDELLLGSKLWES